MSLWRAAQPFLFQIDPERAHGLALRALASGMVRYRAPPHPGLRQTLLGLDFPNPLGMAAGFDKNGEVPDALLALGFGFVEVGTVTPLPQQGSAKPRIFRLPRDQAIINRLGFNNQGHDAVHRRLAARKRSGIVGVNVGPNKDAKDRAGEYAAGIMRFADVADYITLNVSSPNTPGLRDLQEKKELAGLLSRAVTARDSAARDRRRVPLLLKIAPDLHDDSLAAIADTAMASGIEGMIVSNTTLSRESLRDADFAKEAGGLSGRPLFTRSTAILARLRLHVGRRLVLIGVGGVDSADAAWKKIVAGADLVQLYTGLVYRGPGLAAEIVAGLAQKLDLSGFAGIADAVGTEAERWSAARP
jgi:dihydroorotate dehydrogenase